LDEVKVRAIGPDAPPRLDPLDSLNPKAGEDAGALAGPLPR
jgi:hypothetical protein